MSWNLRAAHNHKFSHVDLASLVKLDTYSDVSGSLVKDVIQLYLDTAPAQIQEIKNAVHNNSSGTIHQVSHSLKSASGQIGAKQVAEACQELEEMTRQQNSISNSLPSKIEKLTSLFSDLILELKLILQSIDDTTNSSSGR